MTSARFPVPGSRLPSKPRIALVMMSAIGDVVNALPVANSLRAAIPDMHLTWIIQPAPYALIAGHPAVDEFIHFHRERGWRAYPNFRKRTRHLRFDLVLGLHVYFKAGLVTGLLRAPRKIGLDRARAPDGNWLFTNERLPARPVGHVLDQHMEFLDHLSIPRRLEWGLGPTEEERARYLGLLTPDDRPTIALSLASTRRQKDWPAERYAALVDCIARDLGARTIVVGAPSEPENRVMEMVFEHAQHPPLDLRARDLRRLTYLLDRADVIVTPDSAPLHIGVALGTPTVSLMGYTNPKRVGPYGRFQDLLIDAYGDPGEDYRADAGYRENRMERISVDQVVEKAALALARHTSRR